MQKLSLGFSPCPNDTFIFDAMIHGKIDTEGLIFDLTLGDVEELNDKALKGQLDISKLSYHAMVYCLHEYQLLNSGSALGSGVGPLLIAKKLLSAEELSQATIAIPGKYTTANFLLSLAYPSAQNKVETLFSDIEKDVLSGKVDAGLIIHENRFTYQERGLVKIIDLGNFWEETSNNLIPLGGIVVKRNFDSALKQKVDRVLKRSIEFAFANRDSSQDYIKANAQEMDDTVIQKHIDLYVNEYSIDLGEKGTAAVHQLFEEALKRKIVEKIVQPIIVEK
ncbi:MAG: 1,4-dihydroxy-6-naphthoate synthase [Flavobacteriales bacterium]|nr:1,4-dihydroxy-6-naphthoate synthase [Flavobacteriales bacterium]